MNEKYKEFLDIVDVPIKSHLLNIGDKETLERYRVLRTEIENELEELKEFAKIICTKGIDLLALADTRKIKTYNERSKFRYSIDYTNEQFDLVKKVVSMYGK